VFRNESLEMIGHRGDISRHQNAISVRGELKNFWIKRAVRDHTGGTAKIDRRFPPPQPSSDLRIQVRIGLETEAQAGFTDLSLLARSKRSIMSGVRGLRALISS